MNHWPCRLENLSDKRNMSGRQLTASFWPQVDNEEKAKPKLISSDDLASLIRGNQQYYNQLFGNKAQNSMSSSLSSLNSNMACSMKSVNDMQLSPVSFCADDAQQDDTLIDMNMLNEDLLLDIQQSATAELNANVVRNTVVTTNNHLDERKNDILNKLSAFMKTDSMSEDVLEQLRRVISESNKLSAEQSQIGQQSAADMFVNLNKPTEKVRYKTEFCRNLEKNKFCQFGDFCHFAHTEEELRPRSLDPKYKTSNCRSYHGPNGICYYAKRCDYIHGESPEELMRIRRYNQLFEHFYGNVSKQPRHPPSYKELEAQFNKEQIYGK